MIKVEVNFRAISKGGMIIYLKNRVKREYCIDINEWSWQLLARLLKSRHDSHIYKKNNIIKTSQLESLWLQFFQYSSSFIQAGSGWKSVYKKHSSYSKSFPVVPESLIIISLWSFSSHHQEGSKGSRALRPDMSNGTCFYLWRSSSPLDSDRTILTEMSGEAQSVIIFKQQQLNMFRPKHPKQA